MRPNDPATAGGAATGLGAPGLAQRLRTDPLVDLGGLLDDRGREAVLTAIERARSRGFRARVVCLPLSAPFEGVDALFRAVAEGHAGDTLLVVFNGRGWRGRGLGLPIARVQAELTAATPAFRLDRGRGLALAIDRLLAAKAGAEQAAAAPGGRQGGTGLGVPVGLALGGAAAVGGLAWLLARRRKRAQEGRE